MAVIAVAAVFLIRNFLVQPFLVSGTSMVPTFKDGDYLLIDELTYRLRAPERGEVVVFHSPNDPSTYFIKRIVGLPGEKVEVQDGKVIVFNTDNPQGKALDESYLPPNTYTSVCENQATFNLSSDEYLTFGDNRRESWDSRCWGSLSKSKIIGVVRLRLWPVDAAKVFAAPQYN